MKIEQQVYLDIHFQTEKREDITISIAQGQNIVYLKESTINQIVKHINEKYHNHEN